MMCCYGVTPSTEQHECTSPHSEQSIKSFTTESMIESGWGMRCKNRFKAVRRRAGMHDVMRA